jgi:hypothetical protein
VDGAAIDFESPKQTIQSPCSLDTVYEDDGPPRILETRAKIKWGGQGEGAP